LDVSLNWVDIQHAYVAELAKHAARAQALGVDCPLDVFEQLCHDHHDDLEMARIIAWTALIAFGILRTDCPLEARESLRVTHTGRCLGRPDDWRGRGRSRVFN
jgi:hypothetical protein